MAQAKERSATQRRESRDKAALSLGQFDDYQLNPLLFGLLGRCVPGVGLVNEGNFDRLAGRLLHRLAPVRRIAHDPAH